MPLAQPFQVSWASVVGEEPSGRLSQGRSAQLDSWCIAIGICFSNKANQMHLFWCSRLAVFQNLVSALPRHNFRASNISLKCGLIEFKPALYCFSVSGKWTMFSYSLCYMGRDIYVYLLAKLWWRLQILLLHFCMPAHRQSDGLQILSVFSPPFRIKNCIRSHLCEDMNT